MKKDKTEPPAQDLTQTNYAGLFSDIQAFIEESRASVAVAVNAGLTALYWRIGKRINDDVLQGQRAEYGDKIVSTLSRQLVNNYGNGFSAKNIRHMMKFAEAFPDVQIVSTLSRQLSWSHFKEIIYKIAIWKKTSKMPSCVNWNHFCWSWELVLPS